MAKYASAQERTQEDIRTNPPLILNTLEAGYFLRLSKRKIEYLIKSRSLPSVKIDGSIRVRLQDINQFLESRVRKGVAL
jgi:excisionase family DNA binding protein